MNKTGPDWDDKCWDCSYRRVKHSENLCAYGRQILPAAAMRGVMGMCGPEAILFEGKDQRSYAEFDNEPA